MLSKSVLIAAAFALLFGGVVALVWSLVEDRDQSIADVSSAVDESRPMVGDIDRNKGSQDDPFVITKEIRERRLSLLKSGQAPGDDPELKELLAKLRAIVQQTPTLDEQSNLQAVLADDEHAAHFERLIEKLKSVNAKLRKIHAARREGHKETSLETEQAKLLVDQRKRFMKEMRELQRPRRRALRTLEGQSGDQAVLQRATLEREMIRMEHASQVGLAAVEKEDQPADIDSLPDPDATVRVAILKAAGTQAEAGEALAAVLEALLSSQQRVELVDRAALDAVSREAVIASLSAGSPSSTRRLAASLADADRLVIVTPGHDGRGQHLSVVDAWSGLRLGVPTPPIDVLDSDALADTLRRLLPAIHRSLSDMKLVAAVPTLDGRLVPRSDGLASRLDFAISDALARRGAVQLEMSEAQALTREAVIRADRRLGAISSPAFMLVRIADPPEPDCEPIIHATIGGPESATQHTASLVDMSATADRLAHEAVNTQSKVDGSLELLVLAERARSARAAGHPEIALRLIDMILLFEPRDIQAFLYSSELTEELIERLIDDESQGSPSERADAIVGVSRAGLERWLGFVQLAVGNTSSHIRLQLPETVERPRGSQVADGLIFPTRLDHLIRSSQRTLPQDIYVRWIEILRPNAFEAMALADRRIGQGVPPMVLHPMVRSLSGIEAIEADPRFLTQLLSLLEVWLKKMPQRYVDNLVPSSSDRAQDQHFAFAIEAAYADASPSFALYLEGLLAKKRRRWINASEPGRYVVDFPAEPPAFESGFFGALPQADTPTAEPTPPPIAVSEMVLGFEQERAPPLIRGVAPCGDLGELFWTHDTVYLAPPQGPCKELATFADGESQPGDHKLEQAAFDGRWVWAMSISDKPRLVIVDPQDPRSVHRFGPDDGVPPGTTGTCATPYAEGKAVLAGSFGHASEVRMWIVLAEFDGQRLRVERLASSQSAFEAEAAGQLLARHVGRGVLLPAVNVGRPRFDHPTLVAVALADRPFTPPLRNHTPDDHVFIDPAARQVHSLGEHARRKSHSKITHWLFAGSELWGASSNQILRIGFGGKGSVRELGDQKLSRRITGLAIHHSRIIGAGEGQFWSSNSPAEELCAVGRFASADNTVATKDIDQLYISSHFGPLLIAHGKIIRFAIPADLASPPAEVAQEDRPRDASSQVAMAAPVVVPLPVGSVELGERGTKTALAKTSLDGIANIERGLSIMSHEVTRLQYLRLMEPEAIGTATRQELIRWSWTPIACGASSAHAYSLALSRHTGQTWRLPTEAEWEYACRAGSDDAPPHDIQEVWCQNGSGSQLAGVAPMMQKQANALGLYDMLGNLPEWTVTSLQVLDDAERSNSYAQDLIARGGGWSDPPDRCQPWSRRTGSRAGLRLVLDEREQARSDDAMESE